MSDEPNKVRNPTARIAAVRKKIEERWQKNKQIQEKLLAKLNETGFPARGSTLIMPDINDREAFKEASKRLKKRLDNPVSYNSFRVVCKMHLFQSDDISF